MERHCMMSCTLERTGKTSRVRRVKISKDGYTSFVRLVLCILIRQRTPGEHLNFPLKGDNMQYIVSCYLTEPHRSLRQVSLEPPH
jgi:hypothetical protein